MNYYIKTCQGSVRETQPTRLLPIGKLNRNVLIVGSSGTGKSRLLQAIEEVQPPTVKILFKSDNEKAFSVNQNRIYFESDKINFIDSWKESQQADSLGYMLLQEINLLTSAKNTDQPLATLKRNLRNLLKASEKINKPVLEMIINKLEQLYPSNTNRPLKDVFFDSAKDIISKPLKLSMEGLTEQEYIFFSDYILRQSYSLLLNEIISIDEAHRLKPLLSGLLSTMAREIRTRGGLILTTQSLSDIPPEMLNNFGTIFLFPTFSPLDLQICENIMPEIKETILQLDDHEFIELRSFSREYQKGRAYKMELIL